MEGSGTEPTAGGGAAGNGGVGPTAAVLVPAGAPGVTAAGVTIGWSPGTGAGVVGSGGVGGSGVKGGRVKGTRACGTERVRRALARIGDREPGTWGSRVRAATLARPRSPEPEEGRGGWAEDIGGWIGELLRYRGAGDGGLGRMSLDLTGLRGVRARVVVGYGWGGRRGRRRLRARVRGRGGQWQARRGLGRPRHGGRPSRHGYHSNENGLACSRLGLRGPGPRSGGSEGPQIWGSPRSG